MINLTPHDININGTVFPRSGHVARVTVAQKDAGTVGGIPVRKNTYGSVMVEGKRLAELYPLGEVAVLVSGMVLDALRAEGYRSGAYAPDTGPTAVRNEKGHIEYVTGVVGL